MSAVVDNWVRQLKGKLKPIGDMTHWERLAAAFDLKETDLVPVAPELDYWQITYAGFSHQEIYNDVDKTTDACIKTWADLRTDAIWMYVDIAHMLEPFLPAEKRAAHFIHRGPKDYLLFKPLVETIDEAIALYEDKVWEKYIGDSRAVTHWTPHMLQLLEFQEKMGRQVPIIVGAASPINYAETVVEVQRLVRWTITQPAKVKHYLDLCLQERLASLDFFRDVARANGCEFFCIFGGARTWGPKQLEQFGDVDRQFLDKARQIFPYVMWHHCGHNVPLSLQKLSEWAGLKAVQFDMPYPSLKQSWAQFYESTAKLFSGKRCAMNAPTTQLACYGTADEVTNMVNEFIACTRPYTTAVVMPGCEVDSYAPVENVQAMIDAARRKR